MKKLILIFIILLFINGVANALPNVALNGIATQSSSPASWANNPGYAELAIDGNTDGNFYNGSVTHTDDDYQAWWEVDLLNEYYIDEIIVWNRTDACQTRIIPSVVSVLDSNRNIVWNEAIWNYPGAVNDPWEFSSINITGQYVRVQLEETDYLHMAEVQVFSSDNINSVPEPATIILLGTCIFAFCLGFGISKKKRIKKKDEGRLTEGKWRK